MQLYYPAMPSETTDPNRRRSPAEVDLADGEVCIVESHHSAEFTMDLDTWPFHKIAWVAMGKGTLEFGPNRRELQRNDFVVLPSGTQHRFIDEPRSPLTLVLLCISTPFVKSPANPERAEIWEMIARRSGQVLRSRTAFHETAMLERFRQALREQSLRAVGWKTALRGITDAVLLSIARGNSISSAGGTGRDSRAAVLGAVEHIDAHPHELLRISEMAAQCQLSERRFSQIFKEQTGETFSTYLNQRRIQHACERLRETGHILYACHESGFNDPAYFYRVFKQYAGLTPGAFLQRLPVK